MPHEPGPSPLAGLRVLIVEDEFPILLLIEDMLESFGCAVTGTASTIEEALGLAAATDAVAAVLDINIAGRKVFPVAEVLRERQCAILFSTGYGRAGLDDPWLDHPVVQKPFSADQLAQALRRAIGLRGPIGR